MKRILLLCVGLLLCVDAIWLLTLDKIHLGILLPLVIGCIFLISGLFTTQIHNILDHSPKLKRLWRAAWWLFWLWLLSLLLFFAYLHFNSHQSKPFTSVQAIIVLGSGIENGQPSPTLKARLDAAAPYALQQPNTIVIMTGGLGFNEKITESSVMKRYLLQHYDISAARLYEESKSTSTELNLINSKMILKQHQISLDAPIAIASSDFHLPRAKAIAQKLGYTQVYTIAAPTPLYIRYNSWLREYFAFLSGFVLNEY